MGDQEFLKAMGQRITARRKALGMTQEELAEQLDVSPQMISLSQQELELVGQLVDYMTHRP